MKNLQAYYNARDALLHALLHALSYTPHAPIACLA
jgi:hypothetical protein